MPFLNIFCAVLFGLAVFLLLNSLLARWSQTPKNRSGGVTAVEGDAEPGERVVISDAPFGLGRTGLARPAARLGARLPFRDDPTTVEARLRRSGWRYKSVSEFYGSKVLNAIFLFVLAVVITTVLQLPVFIIVAAALVFGLIGLFNADLEVNKAIEQRRKAIFREMAWTLDRLAVLMETGSAVTTGLNDLVYMAKGRGGLFTAILREIANDLQNNENPATIIETIRAASPESAELDTFLQLLRVNLQGQPIVPQVKALAASMRDELTNEIENRRQAAEMRVVIISSAVVMPAMLIVIGGPVFLSVTSLFR